MEKPNGNKIFNIVFSLLFLGVVLSFSVFFRMLGSEQSGYKPNGYFGGADGGGELLEYDTSILQNKLLHSMIVDTEYRLFGNIKQDNVIKGRNGFLFYTGKNAYGYDYISDFFGYNTLTEAQLETIYQTVDQRRQAYQNSGRYYFLAVIPNSQTVYSENMPAYFTDISGKTMLSQISGYMSEKGNDFFIDLTEVVKGAKTNGLLYNNTENSINALGAYYIYSAVMDRLPEDIVGADRKLDVSEFEYYTHFTDGKSIAAHAGLESMIKNETVSMSNMNEFKYTVVDHLKNVQTTYVKAAYRNEVSSSPYILLKCSNEWDKIQLMPYFSNTFGVASYKVGTEYDSNITEQTNPLIVIQTIREDELLLLLDPNANSSYGNALGENTTAYRTGAPQGVQCTVLNDNSACISGTVENGAEVYVFGDGFEPITAQSIGGRFFVSVTVDGDIIGREILINAKAGNKPAGDHVSVFVSGENNVGSARDVLVGSNSMLYSSNYNMINDIPLQSDLDTYEDMLRTSFSALSEYCGSQIIFATVPEKLSVYTEGLPPHLEKQLQHLENIKSVFSGILENAGARPLDLSECLIKRIGEDKMFYQTDEKITDLAYYYMYCEIIGELSKTFPGLSPISAGSLNEYSAPVQNGSLSASLGFDSLSVTESVIRLKLANDRHYFKNADGSYTTYTPNAGLSGAVIVYDDKSAPLIDLLCENFRRTYVIKNNGTGIPKKVMEEIKPDCVIYLCDEVNIDFTTGY